MKEGKLKIHSENILPIIKKWLYSDKDIFVRELVSNASDAISKLIILRERGEAFSDDVPFRIDLILNKEAKTLTIQDNGIGMTSDEVETYIAQLAFSGAEVFLEKYKSQDDKEAFIGHFGLGFYSAFMVSRLVEIHTLSYQENAKPAYWKCDGSSTYFLEEGIKKERGTEIILHLQDEEYLAVDTLLPILKNFCRFLPYPIYLGETQINKEEPLWIKKQAECEDKEYKEFYHTLYPSEQDPVFWVHVNVDHPFHLKGILYFPKITPRFDFQSSNIKLFCNRVFVTDNCKDLFPDFLTVLRGAIDSPDIPLNVSRSYLQMDKTVRQLSSHITKKIADKLSFLYTEDRSKFLELWPQIETIIKLGILHDEKFYERAKVFLLWKTTKGNFLTLEEYLNQYKDAYKGKVFYTTHDAENSHFLKLYQDKNIEVILAGGPLDHAMFNFLEPKLSLQFQRIDGGIDDIILDKERENTLLDTDGRTESARLQDLVKSHLHLDDVDVEAKSLASDALPGFVMIDENMRRLRDYLSMTQKEMPRNAFGKHTFVINTNHKLTKNIETLHKKDPELAKELVKQIYDLSLLAQREMHPENLTDFINRSSEVLAKLISHMH